MAPVRSAMFRPLWAGRFADAATNAQVLNHTRAGAGEAGGGSGVQIFNTRQSSIPCVIVLPAGLTCGQIGGLAAVACSVDGAQGTDGCGGFQRKVPTGGAANGMPRNAHDEPR